jgi:hypothetical protein
VLITRGSKTVQRNVRDRRDKSKESSGVRVVFSFRCKVDFKNCIVLESTSLKWCYYS